MKSFSTLFIELFFLVVVVIDLYSCLFYQYDGENYALLAELHVDEVVWIRDLAVSPDGTEVVFVNDNGHAYKVAIGAQGELNLTQTWMHDNATTLLCVAVLADGRVLTGGRGVTADGLFCPINVRMHDCT